MGGIACLDVQTIDGTTMFNSGNVGTSIRLVLHTRFFRPANEKSMKTAILEDGEQGVRVWSCTGVH